MLIAARFKLVERNNRLLLLLLLLSQLYLLFLTIHKLLLLLVSVQICTGLSIYNTHTQTRWHVWQQPRRRDIYLNSTKIYLSFSVISWNLNRAIIMITNDNIESWREEERNSCDVPEIQWSGNKRDQWLISKAGSTQPRQRQRQRSSYLRLLFLLTRFLRGEFGW